MEKRKRTPHYKKNIFDDEYKQNLKEYCCEKFREEAERIIACVQNGKPVPDECYFELQTYLIHLFDFNRSDSEEWHG